MTHPANPTPDGREMHTCIGYQRAAFDCEEGYACTRFGCEWCGDDDGAQTRCTWGVD